MAVGLGKMLGFNLPENFNYPYLARNVGEFWRRWHISLSSWFKDYLYIPLGGSRKGTMRTCLNLMIVFLCTGFWHGAGLSFIAWGLYYGVLQVAERLFLKKRLEHLPGNHKFPVYVLCHGHWMDHCPGGFPYKRNHASLGRCLP